MFLKSPKTDFNFYNKCFIIIFIFAALFRYPYIFITRCWSDEALYCWFGKQLFLHPSLILSREVTSWHPPLFAVFLALAHWIFPSFVACHFISYLFYLIGIIAVYRLGTILGNSFIGLFSAILLAFNPRYFDLSTCVLLDIPLMVFCTILAILLFRMDEKSPLKIFVFIGIWGTMAILLKWSGLMVIPWIFIYYLTSLKQLSFKKRIGKFLITFFIVFLALLLLGIKNYVQLGHFYPYGPNLNGLGVKDFWGNLHHFFTPIHPLFYVFFVGGLWKLFTLKIRANSLLLTWLVVFALSIYSISAVNEQRFNILVLPSIIIIIAFGVDGFLDFIQQKFVFREILKPLTLVSVSIFCFCLLLSNFEFLGSINNSFTGYEKAGSYIHRVASKAVLILAGSERQVRYFSGINFKEYGGLIVGFRQEIPEFRELLQQTHGPVIIEVDVWEVDFSQNGYLAIIFLKN